MPEGEGYTESEAWEFDRTLELSAKNESEGSKALGSSGSIRLNETAPTVSAVADAKFERSRQDRMAIGIAGAGGAGLGKVAEFGQRPLQHLPLGVQGAGARFRQRRLDHLAVTGRITGSPSA